MTAPSFSFGISISSLFKPFAINSNVSSLGFLWIPGADIAGEIRLHATSCRSV